MILGELKTISNNPLESFSAKIREAISPLTLPETVVTQIINDTCKEVIEETKNQYFYIVNVWLEGKTLKYTLSLKNCTSFDSKKT